MDAMTTLWDHAVAASSDAPGVQPGEGGSQPTLLLHLPPEDFSAQRYGIRPVGSVTAARWYERWHYLGRPGSGTHWGVFAPDLLAVISLGPPNNDHGIAERFGLVDLPGNVEINRVAVHPDSPTYTSRLVALVLRQAAVGLDWVFSYADPAQGHHGGIYQALGAIYVGLSLQAPASFIVNGEEIHPRSMVARYGTMGRGRLTEMGLSFGRMAPPERKHTYILPVGANGAAVRDRLVALPYPKRDSA